MSDDVSPLDGGWAASADAYIAFQDRGDVNRTLLLDPIMRRLCGDVAGVDVLDDGCGEGRFSRMLAADGARVVAMDYTRGMIETARNRGEAARDRGGASAYVHGDAQRLPFADASFGLLVSYVTLVDIPDHRAAIAEMARVLRPGGAIVVANLGFATASDGWEKAPDGTRLYQRIDRYAEEWSQVYEWVGIKIRNHHRPLSSYMREYLAAGLVLRAFEEPVPEDVSLRQHYWAEDWFRIPLFTVMRWEKPA